MKNITVIATGNELLHGDKIDTNSAVISNELYRHGLTIASHVILGDDRDAFISSVKHWMMKSDTVIITGGLGPTDDDMTVEALSCLFDLQQVIHEESLDKMKRFFQMVGREVNESDLKMVLVPDCGNIIANSFGLAPGFIIEREGRAVIALPGVPHEMNEMLTRAVVPYILQRTDRAVPESASVRFVWMKESEINAFVKSMGIDLSDLQWGMTAEWGIVSLYFTQYEGKKVDLNAIVGECKRKFGISALGNGFHLPEEELLHLLRERGASLAVAESCTGGLIAKRITDIPGASDVFHGSLVAYANESKMDILSVPEELLNEYGAVSEQVAGWMASSVRDLFHADIGVSTTGIAGPGGGSETKPVGTVCFGFSSQDGTVTIKKIFHGERNRVRILASLFAIDNQRRMLIS